MSMENGHILVVDDFLPSRLKLSLGLAQQGHTVAEAENGRQALEFLRSDPFDLVLLDILMPEMDGYEVLTQMKNDPALREIPVIVISAQDEIESIVRGIELGAEDYLPKTFEPTLLRARISSSLEKKRLRDIQQLYLKSLEREMDIARDIQKGFLPTELPDVKGWEIGAYFKAAREVAGDFYDAFLLSDGSLVCVVGDVCDKGVGAALFMTLFRSLIRSTATTDRFSNQKGARTLTAAERLQHVVSFTNNYVAETHGDANMFSTLFIGLINPQDGRFSYINCGNEAALLLRSGQVAAALRPTGPVIGIMGNAKFSVKEMQLEQHDLLLAFTDGIPDALNGDGNAFGNERLQALLGGSEAGPGELLNHIEEDLQQFMGSTKQFDDITLLAIKRNAQ